MGNVLSVESFCKFLFENHEMIGPFLIFSALCIHAWHSFTTFRAEHSEVTEVFERTEISQNTLEITHRFFTNNPGIINVPILYYNGEMMTPFQKACYLQTTPLIRLLIEHGAEVNPDSDEYSFTPFLICISVIVMRNSKDFSSLDTLLDAGCDINVTYPRSHMTALHMAALYNRNDLYEFLWSRGIDDTAVDANGMTAGMYREEDRDDDPAEPPQLINGLHDNIGNSN